MTDGPEIRGGRDSAAVQFMVMDIIQSLVNLAGTPSRSGSHLAQQVRELVGGRFVAVLRPCGEGPGHRHGLMALEPARHRTPATEVLLEALAQQFHDVDEPQLWELPQAPVAVRALLEEAGFNGAMAVPLKVDGRTVGLLLVVHLLDMQRNAESLRALMILAPVAALVLQNALFFEAQESVIEARTRDLQVSERHFHTLAEVAPVGILHMGLEGEVLFVNARWVALTGHISPPPGHPAPMQVHAEDQADVVRRWAELRRFGTSFQAEFRIETPEDGIRWVFGEMVAEREASGTITGFIGSLLDITPRKQAEEALKDRQAMIRDIIETSQDWIWAIDANGIHTFSNPASQRILDRGVDEILGGTNLDLLHEEDRATVEAMLPVWIRERRGWNNLLLRWRHKDGSYRYIESNAVPILGADGNLAGFRGVDRDITERKQMEAQLAETTAILQASMDQNPTGIAIADASAGLLRYVNDAGLLIRGGDRATIVNGVGIDQYVATWQLLDLDGRPLLREEVPLARAVLFGETNSRDLIVRRAEGDDRVVSANAAPVRDAEGRIIAGVVVFTDITERKRLEAEAIQLHAQLMQSQKMESLGTLAGGVAHDMNNVLGAILGLASANVELQPAGSPAHRAFQTILTAAERGGKMIKSLLSFARQSPAEKRILDFNELIREQVRLLERTTLAKVQLKLDLALDLRPMQGDAGALTHVLINLCVNAVDAMPGQGTLTLRTRNAGEGWMEVEVEDTGTGMPPEVLSKALDPFFTTKDVGKGTGLGLSMAYSTVKAHLGQLDIQSEVGRGTCVRMRFPTAAADLEQPSAIAPPEVSEGVTSVLLVDDDELIQSSMSAVLEVLGHVVMSATGGEDALAMLEAGAQPQVVILDMNMPGLGGAGTLPRLRALRPHLPVLLATGRADQAALNLAASQPLVTLISKPFTIQDLNQHLAALKEMPVQGGRPS